MHYDLLLALRGLAALWVLLCHSISGDYKHLAWNSPVFKPLASFMSVGFFGVAIFFLISGYGIAGSMQRYRGRPGSFLLRRIKRILPPYWVSLVLILIEVYMILVSGLQKNSSMPPLSQILEALPLLIIPNLPHLNPVYWTLGYEMHFYLMAGLSLFLFSRTRFLYLFFDVFSIFILIAYVTNLSFGMWDQVFVIRWYWFDFFWGILLYRVLDHPQDWKPWVYAALWQAAYWHVFIHTPGRYFVSPIAFLVLLLLRPWNAFLTQARWMKPLFWLGQISFSLFLTNVMVGPKLIGVVNRLTVMTTGIYVGILTLGTLGSLAVAYAFYKYVERPLAERWG